MIRSKTAAKPAFTSIFPSMMELPTVVSYGAAPLRIVRSQAPIVGALWNPIARDHRLDIDKHPARSERGEEPVPAAFA